MPRKYHEDAAQGEEPRQTAEVINAELIRELATKLEDAQYELGRAEARLELTSQTESTLRAERERLLEDLARERERADRLETELQEARKPPPELPEDPETASEEQDKGTASLEQEKPSQRSSWWRRFFGLE